MNPQDWEKGRTKEVRAKADLGRLGQRRGQGQANYEKKREKGWTRQITTGKGKRRTSKLRIWWTKAGAAIRTKKNKFRTREIKSKKSKAWA